MSPFGWEMLSKFTFGGKGDQSCFVIFFNASFRFLICEGKQLAVLHCPLTFIMSNAQLKTRLWLWLWLCLCAVLSTWLIGTPTLVHICKGAAVKFGLS